MRTSDNKSFSGNAAPGRALRDDVSSSTFHFLCNPFHSTKSISRSGTVSTSVLLLNCDRNKYIPVRLSAVRPDSNFLSRFIN
jgi:hypothetical protein